MLYADGNVDFCWRFPFLTNYISFWNQTVCNWKIWPLSLFVASCYLPFVLFLLESLYLVPFIDLNTKKEKVPHASSENVAFSLREGLQHSELHHQGYSLISVLYNIHVYCTFCIIVHDNDSTTLEKKKKKLQGDCTLLLPLLCLCYFHHAYICFCTV